MGVGGLTRAAPEQAHQRLLSDRDNLAAAGEHQGAGGQTAPWPPHLEHVDDGGALGDDLHHLRQQVGARCQQPLLLLHAQPQRHLQRAEHPPSYSLPRQHAPAPAPALLLLPRSAPAPSARTQPLPHQDQSGQCAALSLSRVPLLFQKPISLHHAPPHAMLQLGGTCAVVWPGFREGHSGAEVRIHESTSGCIHISRLGCNPQGEGSSGRAPRWTATWRGGGRCSRRWPR